MEEEVWRPIHGHAGYEASSLGRVRSIPRTIIRLTKRGPVQVRYQGRVLKGRPLKRGKQGAGYLTVQLGGGNGHLVHRLVLLAWVGPPGAGEECAHWNGVRTDNRLTNLRWASRESNHADKHRHGTMPMGETHQWWAGTHCKNGHEFTFANTGRTSKRRYCRTCRRMSARGRRSAAAGRGKTCARKAEARRSGIHR